MADRNDILWFKTNFSADILPGLRGTPFDLDMLTAIACQETGELWSQMRRVPGLTKDRIAALCCGDTLDDDGGRSAFPRNRAALEAAPRGAQMFGIARAALLAMAEHVPAYRFAFNRPDKFCHGYGVFQRDLQFFRTDPDYFLDRRYEDFGTSLGRAVSELTGALQKLGLQGRPQISDLEFCHVAIVYNTGRFVPSKGLKQGFPVDGKFYGEFIRDFVALSRRVMLPGDAQAVPPPAPGTAPLPAPLAARATGPFFRVDTVSSNLNLRSEPRISEPSERNVRAGLPDGILVRAMTGVPDSGFIEIEVTLGGRLMRGFAATSNLVSVADPGAAALRSDPVTAAAAGVQRTGPAIPAARLPAVPGRPVRRLDVAGARELAEPDMPLRSGDSPADLRADLVGIVTYLNPANPRHARYAPRQGLTFCNIYAQDYCTRAGVYLPRVWWTAPALVRIAAGEVPEARLNTSVDEMRANDLFRWLRDFGTGFGWRRAAAPTELQDHANTGGVGLIVARRREDGRSGHIVPVVPETAEVGARRNAAGEVTMPVQSQAGSVNFNFGRGTLNWWTDPKFAEFAFWLHA